jgi:hypothetical protein
MKQGIAGFLLGILLAATVYAFAGKTASAESEIGRYKLVAVPGFATKDGYQPAHAWKIDTVRGDATMVY